MLYNKLKEIIFNFWEKDFSDFFKRDFIIPDLKIKKSIALVGPRRSGKTSICFLKIKELLDNGIDIKNILWFN